MELYILLAIIWLGGVIFSGLWRISISIALSARGISYSIGGNQALKGFVLDFFWFIYIPWIALKALFRGV